MAALQLKPAMRLHSSAKSSFHGLAAAFQQMNLAPAAPARSARLQIEGKSQAFCGVPDAFSRCGTPSKRIFFHEFILNL
jgi:hypothetical protein